MKPDRNRELRLLGAWRECDARVDPVGPLRLAEAGWRRSLGEFQLGVPAQDRAFGHLRVEQVGQDFDLGAFVEFLAHVGQRVDGELRPVSLESVVGGVGEGEG